jgi:hypothetical protein
MKRKKDFMHHNFLLQKISQNFFYFLAAWIFTCLLISGRSWRFPLGVAAALQPPTGLPGLKEYRPNKNQFPSKVRVKPKNPAF